MSDKVTAVHKFLWIVFIVAMFVAISLGLYRPQDDQDRLRSSLGLPWGATNVKAEGLGWHTFTIEIEGRPRRFLRHQGGGLSATESIVELHEPGLPSSSGR